MQSWENDVQIDRLAPKGWRVSWRSRYAHPFGATGIRSSGPQGCALGFHSAPLRGEYIALHSRPNSTSYFAFSACATQYRNLLERMNNWPSLMAGVLLKSPLPAAKWFWPRSLNSAPTA